MIRFVELSADGNVLTNLFLVVSSNEIKENILSLCSQEAFEVLEHLSPVKFNYKAEDTKKVHLEFVAEEVPELVATSNRRGVSIMDLVAILTEAVKEQQKTIKTLANGGLVDGRGRFSSHADRGHGTRPVCDLVDQDFELETCEAFLVGQTSRPAMPGPITPPADDR